ncbi:MAG TPA: archease [Candidatus Paceibacterota bacterium]|nr:archease [Candidatus Paceibacterota bacterium]
MAYAFDEHTADIRMHVSGSDLEELFRDALAGIARRVARLEPFAVVKG